MTKTKRNNITKYDFSNKLFESIGISKNLSKKVLDGLIESLTEIIIQKNKLNLKNIGSFKIIEKKERIGRNPKTGEEVPITARSVVTFRASNVLKSKVNTKNKINIVE